MRTFKLTLATALLTCCTASAAKAIGPTPCVIEANTEALTPAIQLIGGTGTFTLSGRAQCPTLGTRWQDVTGSGTYNNVFCGWFTMNGTISIGGSLYGFGITSGAWTGAVTTSTGGAGAVSIVPNETGGGVCASQLTITGTVVF